MTTNPFAQFDTAIETAATIATAEAAERARQQTANADALRAQVEADQALRAAAQITKLHESFVEGFIGAVLKASRLKAWSPTALLAAKSYTMALASRPTVELPYIDPTMAALIQDKYVYGIVLQGNGFPTDLMNGQRQDWFAELFAKKSGATTNDRLDIKPGDRPRLYCSSTSPKPVAVDLLPATTPKAKRDRRPGVGKPGFRKVTVNA